MPRKARSTGCRVCVRRRVRCDETRPSCQRCVKAGLECSGFPPPIQWVDETDETHERLQVISNTGSRSSTPQNPNALDQWRRTAISQRANPEYSTALTRRLKDRPENVYLGYLLSHLFATGRGSDYSGTKIWLSVCLKNEEGYPTSNLATQALAKAYFGRRHRLQDIVDAGSRSYGRALLALCEDLKDARKSLSYDVLAATATLTLYEHLIFSTREGWVQHSQGTAHLIKMRGPERFRTYPGRAILDMNRQMIILQALVARKRTFLEQDRWIEVAWPESTPRPLIVRLHDIFAKFPGMTEDVLKMETGSDVGAEFVLRTQQNIDKIVRDLRVIEHEMLIDESYKVEEQPQALPSRPFDTEFKYQSVIAANVWTSFDAFLIIALEWQYKSRHLDWQKGINHEGYELIPETRKYALNICRSVEYLLQPQWIHAGAFYLLFPSRIAFYALPLSSPEALWLVGILERIAITSGFEMARNVLTNVQINEKTQSDAHHSKAMPLRALPAPSEVQ